MDSAHIWSQSVARRSLAGRERTHNPSPAAASMLGKRRIKRAKAKLKRRGRKRAHRGNPLPAVVGLLGGAGGVLSKLGGRFRKPSEARAASLSESVVQAANQGNLTAARGLIERAAKPMIAKEAAVWRAAAARLSPEIVRMVNKHLDRIPQADQSGPEQFAASVLGNAVTAAGSMAAGSPSALQQIASSLAQPGTIREIARAAKPRASRRSRYPTYIDRQGRQRYSTRPPGSEMRIPAGATPSPGTPYSFFRGAVGSGGALATAGQVAVAAGAGIAAYLVTQKVLEHLGGRAQRKEEAGVNAALALREARRDLERQQGHPVTRAQAKEMADTLRQELVKLGYDPVTFTRQRSGFESFVETYNPFGG